MIDPLILHIIPFSRNLEVGKWVIQKFFETRIAFSLRIVSRHPELNIFIIFERLPVEWPASPADSIKPD